MVAASSLSLVQVETRELTPIEYMALAFVAGMCFVFLVVVLVCLCAYIEGHCTRPARPPGMGAFDNTTAPANRARARNIPRRRLRRTVHTPTEDGYGPQIGYHEAPPAYTLQPVPSSTSGQSQRRQRPSYGDFESIQSQDDTPPPPYAP